MDVLALNISESDSEVTRSENRGSEVLKKDFVLMLYDVGHGLPYCESNAVLEVAPATRNAELCC